MKYLHIHKNVVTILQITHILQLLLFFVETKQSVTLRIMCRNQKEHEKIVIKPVSRENI